MAITAASRKFLGARSVSILLTSNAAAPGNETLSSANLTADATAVELASLPIYSEFLNKNFGAVTADVIAEEFAKLGGVVNGVGGVQGLSTGCKFGVSAGKPTLTFGVEGVAGQFEVRVSIAHTISA